MIQCFNALAIQDIHQSITDQYPSKQWFQYILNHPEYPWNWGGISKNPNLTMNMIEKYSAVPWNWHGVSANPMYSFLK